MFVATGVALLLALYKAPNVKQLGIEGTEISRCSENSLACRDSFGFFADVNDMEWRVRREISRFVK